MSLFRQLWLAVITATLVSFSGSFVVSMLTAQHYLERQLAVKNADNAASLALSMSQLPKDPVTVELQAAALFDSGQYASVRVIDPDGKVMIEKLSPLERGNVPAWFIHLFPLASQPGQAQITDGWNQFGTIEVVSHSRFAYQELWNGGIKLLWWFVIGAGVLGLLGMKLLGNIKRPLHAVVEQAHAISERRFVTIAEPRTPELRAVSRAMNAMVVRLKAIFEEEAQRLEQVRREANIDKITGLANRAYFMNQLELALKDDDAAHSGILFILRIADLAGVNRQCGRETTDELIRRTGQIIGAFDQHAGSASARLNGADFALLLPGLGDAHATAEQIVHEMQGLASAGLIPTPRIAHLAAGHYHHGESVGTLLARIDSALATAEGMGDCAWAESNSCQDGPAASNADWKKLLEGAIETQRLRLIEFPVASTAGALMHLECPLRLQAVENGEWLTAGSFMPMASRLQMTTELDLAAVRLAFDRIAAGLPSVAVNLSGESVHDASFRERIAVLVENHKAQAGQLWLEVSEVGAFQYFEEFRAFCLVLQPYGCRIGVEHFGHRFCEIGRLHDLGLDYLKVDGSFIRNIDQQTGNQAFLKGLCSIAHNIGLIVIAENVRTAEELAALPELGFDGATGPVVSQRQD